MKKKELQKLAKRMAELERIVSANEDPTEVSNAKNEILELSGRVTNFEDIMELDELIQKFLET